MSTAESLQPAEDTDVEATGVAPTGEVVHLSAEDMAILESGRAHLKVVGAGSDLVASTDDLPGDTEFRHLAAMAVMIAASDLAPKDIRNKPYNAFLLLIAARDLGISVTGAINGIDVIEGKPTISPEIMRGLVKDSGKGDIREHPKFRNDCNVSVAIPYRPDGSRFLFHDDETGEDIPEQVEFTWDDAARMGLVLPECRGDDHTEQCRANQTKSGQSRKCKSNWFKMPKRMLWARACAQAAHDYFPEVAMRIYSAEELGAVVDADGRPIDLTQVALPAGLENPYDTPPPEPIKAEDAFIIEVVLASLEDGSELQQKVFHAWKEKVGTKIVDCTYAQGTRGVAIVKGMVPDWQDRIQAFLDAWDGDDGGDGGARRTEDPASPGDAGGATEAPSDPEPTTDTEEAQAEPEATPETQEQLSEERHPEPSEDDPPKARAKALMLEADKAPKPIVEAVVAQVKDMQLDEVSQRLRDAGLPDQGRADQLRSWVAAHMIVERMNDPASAKAIEVAKELEAKTAEAKKKRSAKPAAPPEET